jgi:hypothetical protein
MQKGRITLDTLYDLVYTPFMKQAPKHKTSYSLTHLADGMIQYSVKSSSFNKTSEPTNYFVEVIDNDDDDGYQFFVTTSDPSKITLDFLAKRFGVEFYDDSYHSYDVRITRLDSNKFADLAACLLED